MYRGRGIFCVGHNDRRHIHIRLDVYGQLCLIRVSVLVVACVANHKVGCLAGDIVSFLQGKGVAPLIVQCQSAHCLAIQRDSVAAA